MTKEQLIGKVMEHSGLPKKTVESAVQGFVTAVSEAMAQGESVTLVGFGSFKVAERPERSGRNPRTGEAITIPAGKAVRFQPGKTLKGRLG